MDVSLLDLFQPFVFFVTFVVKKITHHEEHEEHEAPIKLHVATIMRRLITELKEAIH
jgi:hypothetical protein